MCWSNLQPALVQQASPLKGLMQCQNLWLWGHPLFLPTQSDKSWIYFPPYSFLFFLLLNSSAREAWDVNETFSLEGRRIPSPGQRQGRTSSEPMTSPPFLFFSFFFSPPPTFSSCHSRWCEAGWLKSALCQGRHISERHKTCRNINKQQAADSSQALRLAMGDEGKVRTLGGCLAVEVSSSGFRKT